jgi:hypothetical protein
VAAFDYIVGEGCMPYQTGVPAQRGTTVTIQPDISAARPSPDERGIGFSIEQIWPDRLLKMVRDVIEDQ